MGFSPWGHKESDMTVSFSISPSSEYSGLISFRMDWFDLLGFGLSSQKDGVSIH